MTSATPLRSALSLLAILLIGCTKPRPADVLLFTGRGAWPGDVDAVIAILGENHIAYSQASSWQLNHMSEAELRAYRLLIFPGGNFINMGNGLSRDATATIHDAVQNGLNYLGICAGGFLAGHFPSNNSFNLTSGVQFGFYSAERQGIRKTAVMIEAADGSKLDQYWEDGPQLTGWGDVVAKYPDGTPAVAEGTLGQGWVVLSGIHAEAAESWRRGMTFQTSVRTNRDYAGKLVLSALTRQPLPHF